MMQTTNQRQPPYTSWTSWPPVEQIPTGGFTSVADIYPKTYSTTVFATPIKRKADESQTTALFPVSGCPQVSPLRKTYYDNRDLAGHRKPNCSYTVLIGMALKASKSGTLPVSEIYQYIQQEFPFFKTGGPGGWKNSVRHSLSLGQYFRKVERKDGYQGKKGFHWEVVPEKKTALDREVERFMREEGFGKIDMTAAGAATFKSAAAVLPSKPVTAVQSLQSFQSLPAEPELPRFFPPPLESISQVKQSSTEQPDLSSRPCVSSTESIGVTGIPGPCFNAQVSQLSLEQVLSTLGSLDASSLQKLSLSDIQTLMFILNKNLSAVATCDVPSLESNASCSNPHPTSAVIQHISNEPLPSAAGAEMAPTTMAVPSELQLSTSTVPILPIPWQDPQLSSTFTSEQDSPQTSIPVQPRVVENSSVLPILQPDPEMLKQIGLPNTDIVSFADMLTPNNPCDNRKTFPSRIQMPASLSGIPLPEDSNNAAGNSFAPSKPSEVEEDLNRQKGDFIQCEVGRAMELYRSTHPAPQRSATTTDVYASTDNYYTLDSCNGIGNVRPLVDLGSLAETGCVQKSTIHVDIGHLSSQSPFINPTHPRANITLAGLNQEPAMSLDPHHSGTVPYYTPSLLDDVDGTPHSDGFTSAVAPVYHDWNCWNNTEYSARMLQQDLDDFDEVLRQVTFAHEEEEREEEARKRRLCLEETHGIHGDFGADSTLFYEQYAHTGGKWSPSCSDWNGTVENGEHDLIVSIPLTKVTPKSALTHGKRKSRKRKLEDRDDIGGGAQLKKKKKKKYIPAMFAVFISSDESETDLD